MLIVLTLVLAGVSVFIAISLRDTSDVPVAGGDLPLGASCNPADDQCAGNYVCTPNDQGQNVCNDPGTSDLCPGGSCGGVIAFRCNSDFGAECTGSNATQVGELGTDFNSFAEAVQWINGCGQVDTVCQGGSNNRNLCGSFVIVKDSCGSTPPPPPTRYNCDTANFACVAATDGTYATAASCEEACQPPAVRYTCNTETFTCEGDPDGEYSTFASCDLNCNAPEVPPMYSCDTTNFSCVEDPDGDYSSLQTCGENCIPQFCGQPCGGPNGTSCPINHVCDETQDRCVLNQCLNNPECTNNGCMLPATAIYGDSRDYVIFGLFLILVGIAAYKLQLLPQGFAALSSLASTGLTAVTSKIENNPKLTREEKEIKKFKKDRDSFESRFEE